MAMYDRVWAVMVSCKWSALEVVEPDGHVTAIGKVTDDEPCGFIPLFSTREGATAWAGSGRDVVEMRLDRRAGPLEKQV